MATHNNRGKIVYGDGKWLIDEVELAKLLENSDESDDENFEPLSTDLNKLVDSNLPSESDDNEEIEVENTLNTQLESRSEATNEPTPVWQESALLMSFLPLEHTCAEKIEMDSPIQYFYKYFDSQHFINTAFFTNMYHLKRTGKELKTNYVEIRKLYGIFMIMGCITYPRMHLYWSNTIGLSKISKYISRNRFQTLRSSLHFLDTSIVPPNNSNLFWKVQPIIDSVRTRCIQINRKIERYSIDEQMIPFTGRMPARQFVKNKPRPVGLKNLVVTTSAGLVMDFEIYQGGLTNLKYRNLGLGPSIVLRLVETLPQGSFLYFDRYFSTVALFKKLHEMNFKATGTIIANRIKQVHFKPDRELKRGESQEFTYRDANLTISTVKWKDSKCVTAISTVSGVNPVSVVDRWCKKQKKYVQIECPSIINDYNMHMGGVDICDQQMEYYRTFFKTRKWPLKVAHHFIDLAVVNSWMEYKQNCLQLNIPKSKIMDLLSFKMDVADSLISEEYNNNYTDLDDYINDDQPVAKKKKMETLPSLGRRFSSSGHWPVWDELSTARMCRFKACKCRTRCRCEKCNIYLCSTKTNNCFKLFHTTQD